MTGDWWNFRTSTPLVVLISALVQYAIVLIPTFSFGSSFQGVLCGSTLACCYLGVLVSRSFYLPGGVMQPLVFGALLGVIPATYVSSTLVMVAELSRAVGAYGEDGFGLHIGEGNPEVTTADVFALRDLKPENFRYDMMGQAHEALPVKEENGARKAGKTEEGTFCAVPVVGDEWKVNEPVPFWYVCENNFQFFVECRDAYEGVYADKDYYGYRILRECLRAPLDIMEGWLTSEQVGQAEILRKSPAVLSYNNLGTRKISAKDRPSRVNPATEKVNMGRGETANVCERFQHPSCAVLNESTTPRNILNHSAYSLPLGEVARRISTFANNGTVDADPQIISKPNQLTGQKQPSSLLQNHTDHRLPALRTRSPVQLMYFYRLGFMSTNIHITKFAQTALMHSSIRFHVALRGEPPKLRLATYQEPCCTSHKANLIENIFAAALGPVLAAVLAHLTLTIFRALSRRQGSSRTAFKTRQQIASV